MKTQTAIITGPQKVEIQEIELPPLGPQQVLVRVKSCAICTWEQRFYKGCSPEEYPFRGGHEVAGEVVELGSNAIEVASIGDPVALAIMTRCGACDNCRRGMDNFCELDAGGHPPYQLWGPGGLSEFVILQDYQVYKARVGSNFDHLALAEPVACVIRSVNRPELEFGDHVLVQGTGIMGLLHVLLLKQLGVRVMVSEPNAVRRGKALALGADMAADPMSPTFERTVLDFNQGKKFRAIFFTSGGIPAIQQALNFLSKGGWLCLYGSVHPKGLLEIDPNDIHYNEWIVTGTFSHTKNSFRQAVSMLSQNMINVAPFISERVPFPDVGYAFERALSPDTYRVIVAF